MNSSPLKRGATGTLKLLAALAPIGITALFTDSVVSGGTDRSAAAIVTWLLPISAFVVFILRRRSPVCYGCCAAGWLYFLSPLLVIVPPLWFVYVYVFPSAWTTVNGFYRADQYWPDDYLANDLEFALGDYSGARLFAAAHPLWTVAFAASGAIAALCWNWGNPLYREWPPTKAPESDKPTQFTLRTLFAATGVCAVLALLAPRGASGASILTVLALIGLTALAGLWCVAAFVVLCGLGSLVFSFL